MVDYATARESIRSGDLLAWRSKSLLSLVIRMVSAGSWSHVGVAWWFKDRLFVMEAREGVGVGFRAVSETLPFDHIATGADWSDEAETYGISVFGRKYSYADAARAGLGVKFSGEGKICSEFAVDLLRRTGNAFLLSGRKGWPNPVTPSELVEHFLDRGATLRSIRTPEVE